MPFKHNAQHRHRIPRQKFKVTNWAEYEAGLRQRGSLTFWFSGEACAAWLAAKRKTRGGQPRYSYMAIETTLTLGLVFGLPLRQIEGFVISLFRLMGRKRSLRHTSVLERRAINVQHNQRP